MLCINHKRALTISFIEKICTATETYHIIATLVKAQAQDVKNEVL